MQKRDIYEGSWDSYLQEIKKTLSESYVHSRFSEFKECFDLGLLPDKAIEFLILN